MLKHLDLFSGIGGVSLGLEASGRIETVAFCEIEPFQRAVLKKNWPGVKQYDDVRCVTAVGIVRDGVALPDLISGGFPCQDLSATGLQRGLGEETRSGLFRHILRLARECGELGKKPYLLFENVGRLLSGPAEEPGRWFGEFLHALAEVGYDAEWFCLSAASVGAPHERDRVWIVAYPHEAQLERGGISRRVYEKHADFGDARWGQDKPGVVRTLNGLPHQMDRVGALGNAVCPPVVAIIGEALAESLL